MLRIELEKAEGRYRVWSEENNRYMLRHVTEVVVENFYRQQAVRRADMATAQFIEDAKQAGWMPIRQPDVLS